MCLRSHDRRLSLTVLIAGLLTVAFATSAVREHRRADLVSAELKEARAGSVGELEAARLASRNEEVAKARAKLADSRRIAALSESERVDHPDRALILAVEAIHLESTLEARSSLIDALSSRPAVTSFLHRAEGGYATSVAFSPDGRTLAMGCQDAPRGGVVILWSATRPAEKPLIFPEGSVRSAVFSPDGRTLAAGAGRGLVLWDVAQRARLGDRTLDVPEGFVSSVAFSADGKRVAAGCSRGKVVLFDVSRRVRLSAEPLLINSYNEDYEVKSLAFHGKALVAVCGDRLELWNPEERKRISVLSRPETEPIECAALSPDGTTLAAGVEGSENVGAGVLLWDMTTLRRLTELPLAVFGDHVASLAFSADGATLAAGCGDSVVQWDLSRKWALVGKPLVIVEADVTSVALSSDGASLAAGFRRPGGDGGAVVWDFEGRSRLADRPLSLSGDVLDVAFSPDGSTLAAAYALGSTGGVSLWDARRRTRLTDKPLEISEGFPTSVAYSADGATIAAGYLADSGDGGVVLWDSRRHTRVGDKPLTIAGGGNVFDVAFNPDGTTVAGVYIRSPRVGGLALWDARRATQIADKPLDESLSLWQVGVAFSHDGKSLAVGYGGQSDGDLLSGGVELWDSRGLTRRADRRMAVDEGPVTSVAISPDGSTIAATCHGRAIGGHGGVVLWNARSGIRLADKPQDVAAGSPGGVIFSPDSRTLAVAGNGGPVGGVVVLWDIRQRRRVSATPLEIGGHVTSLAFSPDGKTLAAGYRYADPDLGGRGGVVLFDLDIESWIDRAARIANRNLTRQEWRRYFPETPYHATFNNLSVPPEEETGTKHTARPLGRNQRG